jgi:hypothetical protein
MLPCDRPARLRSADHQTSSILHPSTLRRPSDPPTTDHPTSSILHRSTLRRSSDLPTSDHPTSSTLRRPNSLLQSSLHHPTNDYRHDGDEAIAIDACQSAAQLESAIDRDRDRARCVSAAAQRTLPEVLWQAAPGTLRAVLWQAATAEVPRRLRCLHLAPLHPACPAK